MVHCTCKLSEERSRWLMSTNSKHCLSAGLASYKHCNVSSAKYEMEFWQYIFHNVHATSRYRGLPHGSPSGSMELVEVLKARLGMCCVGGMPTWRLCPATASGSRGNCTTVPMRSKVGACSFVMMQPKLALGGKRFRELALWWMKIRSGSAALIAAAIGWHKTRRLPEGMLRPCKVLGLPYLLSMKLPSMHGDARC